MKKYIVTLLVALSSPLFALADNAVARPDIEELFTVMRVEKTMQSAMEQVKKTMPQMMAGMASQMNMQPGELEKSQAMQQKMLAIVESEMSWSNLKGEMIKIYAESLTPEEVKGITAFYKSPVGQAFLNKQPVIMQKSMQMQQKLMMNMMPKIQDLIKTEIEAAKDAK